MKANFITYDFDKSLWRLDEILNASNDEFKDIDIIPNRESLTYTNWFYTYCTALFVDIRDSSSLPDKHNKPVLAKIYRSYISEIVAILNWNINCKEISIEWDCVWWVFNTPLKSDIDEIFNLTAQISSLIDILNCKLQKKGFETILIWIWMDYWRALMIKWWYNWSGINDVIWMGDVVNRASKLCSYWNKIQFSDKRTMVSNVIYWNLNEHNKSLLEINKDRWCYHWDIIWTNMNNWKDLHCN